MDLGYYSSTTGDINLYSLYSTDREHVSTMIHERAHRLISEKSNNTSFFQLLTALKDITTDSDHKELIEHIIASFHHKTKTPHESIATWVAFFIQNVSKRLTLAR